jgi:hypothetical protein
MEELLDSMQSTVEMLRSMEELLESMQSMEAPQSTE